MNLIPQIDFISAIVLFGVFQAMFLSSVFLLYGRRGLQGPIGFILLILAIIELESFLNYSGYIIYTPWMINVSPPLILTLGPLSFLHIRRITEQKEISMKDAPHFVPALFYFLYSLFFFFQNDFFKVNEVLKGFHPGSYSPGILRDFPTDPFKIQGFVVVEGLSIHILYYALFSMRYLWRLKQNKLSSLKLKNSIHIQWANLWAISLMLGGLIFLSTGGIVNGHTLFKRVLPAYSVDICCVMIIYINMVYWVGHALIPFLTRSKYSKSLISPDTQQDMLNKIKDIMISQKPYKKTDFSLSQLAGLANISPHHTSQVINSGSGMSFNEFVNWHRVNEARVVLGSPVGEQIKVEMLAYELGYKSKSAFFTSFKRYTDTTPGRFRESCLKEMN